MRSVMIGDGQKTVDSRRGKTDGLVEREMVSLSPTAFWSSSPYQRTFKLHHDSPLAGEHRQPASMWRRRWRWRWRWRLMLMVMGVNGRPEPSASDRAGGTAGPGCRCPHPRPHPASHNVWRAARCQHHARPASDRRLYRSSVHPVMLPSLLSQSCHRKESK